MRGVHPLEVGEVAPLAGEQLHHLHAGDGLLQVRVEARDLDPHLAEGLAHLVAEDEGGRRQHRHDAHRRQRHARVDGEDHVGEEHHDEEIGHQGDDPHREHLAEVLEIVGEARDQPSHRIAVEEAQRQFLNVIEQPAPDVGDGALAEHDHRPAAQPLEAEQAGRDRQQDREQPDQLGHGQERRGPQDRGEPGDARAHLATGEEVERGADDQRRHHLERGPQRDERDREPHLAAIRPHERPQPPQQVGVVDLAQRLFLMKVLAGLSSGRSRLAHRRRGTGGIAHTTASGSSSTIATLDSPASSVAIPSISSSSCWRRWSLE